MKQLRKNLDERGATPLQSMPDWELCRYIERLHKRYRRRIIDILEKHNDSWMETDAENPAPGCSRIGALAARTATEALQPSGLYVYATHPSQPHDEDVESGPRWYVSCVEAVMKHYTHRQVAPLPRDMYDFFFPSARDRCRPWLTEAGWTVVPKLSDPQMVHADICYGEDPAPHPRQRARFLHLAWKQHPWEKCTTNFVFGGFTDGSATWDDYEKLEQLNVPVLCFDSEVLHCGGRSGDDWSTTMTLQFCGGSSRKALSERTSERLMSFTFPLGWEVGAAVDALTGGAWIPAVVRQRSEQGRYLVQLKDGRCKGGLLDSQLRYRQPREGMAHEPKFSCRDEVEVLVEGEWLHGKIGRCNADGTFRVVWPDRTFTDDLLSTTMRARSGGVDFTSERLPSAGKRRASKARLCGDVHKRRKNLDDSQVAVEKVPESLDKLVSQGWIEHFGGFPESWKWTLFDFVERYHVAFHDLVIRELYALRGVWRPSKGSNQRHGAFAAWKVSERLRPFGISVYCPLSSERSVSPYDTCGPRWYVSLTKAALKHYGVVPAPPLDLYGLLCASQGDQEGTLRARGLGWTLAPPGSGPQSLHADLWGGPEHPRRASVRFPHLLWKRNREQLCTTEIVPGGFTLGQVQDTHYSSVVQVSANAIVVDSEVLHRGAATKPSVPSSPCCDWASTLSLELCTPSGWVAWNGGTGGTPFNDDDEWRMLEICSPGADDGVLQTVAPEVSMPVLSAEVLDVVSLQAEQKRCEAN